MHVLNKVYIYTKLIIIYKLISFINKVKKVTLYNIVL